MTYKWVRDQVLKLLNQYSIAGTPVAPTYNNQEDYLNRIPSLVNDAVMEIATTAKKIPATVRLADLYREENEGGNARYRLPSNFFQFQTGSVVKTTDGRRLHTNVYQVEDRSYFLIPEDEVGDYAITYYRYPALLPDPPAESARLDNTEETHMAIPYYVAAFLVSGEDAFRCALFNNKYEDKLAKMSSGVFVEVSPVDDVYGSEGGGIYVC